MVLPVDDDDDADDDASTPMSADRVRGALDRRHRRAIRFSSALARTALLTGLTHSVSSIAGPW